MKQAVLALDSTERAVECYREVSLGDVARGLLEEHFNPRQYLHSLIRADQLYDALAVLVDGLPKRAAVGWVCRCIRAEKVKIEDAACLEAAEQWVSAPTEENQRRAREEGVAAGCHSPAALAGVAAGWSGGSLMPPDMDPVPPGTRLTAQAVTAAVMMLLTDRPEDIRKRQLAFLQLGLDLVDGPDPWPATTDKVPGGGGADAPGCATD